MTQAIHCVREQCRPLSTVAMRAAAITVLLLTMAACGVRTVEVRGTYPSPNVPPLPLTLGVYYGEGVRDFVYTEMSDRGKEEYRVLSGNSHVDLFNTVLPAMFQQVVVLDDPANASARGVDAVFVPVIDEFQLGMPQKTRLDSYEVWIRYNMRLVEADGDYIADWVMTAYGKTTQDGFSTTERGINGAAVAALRDLASNFSISLTSIPDVENWLRPQLQ